MEGLHACSSEQTVVWSQEHHLRSLDVLSDLRVHDQVGSEDGKAP